MRTALGKTFTYYIVVLLITFFLLSLGFTEVFKGYFYSDQNDDLLNQAIKISDIYIQSRSGDNIDEEYFNNEISIIDKYMDYSFILFDRDLMVLSKSKDINNLSTGTIIDKFDGCDDVLSGNIKWFQGNIDNIYSQNRYILYYPIVIDDGVKAFVAVSVTLSELTDNINRVNVIVIFFLILFIVLGFITIHWATNEFVKPIRKLSNAANYISKGNFDERIDIDGYLNDEITELCVSFNTMAENLDSLEKRRREIISNISHDLRSPITSIKGFLQAMLDGTIKEEKYKHYLEIIYNETERLNKLSNNILDLNKMDNSINALDMVNFDINVVIAETINLMKNRAERKGIELMFDTCQSKVIVYADIDKIRRVLGNLMDNAIKFTEKGYVKINSEIRGNKAYISVDDTGIGLSKEEQSRVFERLYKADASRGMDKTGSGLGLAIVKEFIKAHNQTIELKSEEGRGSCFTFTLDLGQ